MFAKEFFTQPFDWRIYKKYFKGQTLEEELAYSNYYHFELGNRLLHFVSFICIYCLLTAQIVNVFGVTGNLAWSIFFFLLLSKISIPISIFYLIAMQLGYSLLYGLFPVYFTPIMVLIFQLFQLIGHLAFEKKFPAFRFFEALVTTPILVALTSINQVFPLQRELLQNVTKQTTIWKQKIES